MSQMVKAVVVFWCLCPLSIAGAVERVAFVIGNSDYHDISSLENPKNDADDVASRLLNLGFELHGDKVHKDLTRRQLKEQIKSFAKVAENKEMALFYFAGHGMQFKGDPHLLPVDIPNHKDLDIVKGDAISLNTLLYTLNQTAEVTIAVFDACRDIPDYDDQIGRTVLGGSRAEWRGLSPPQVKVNSTLIAYSGGSGEIVKDGKGQRNSPYTQMLLEELTIENLKEKQLDIRGTFDEVSHRFRLKHQGGQQPEVLSKGVPPGQYYLFVDIPEKIEIVQTNKDGERQTEHLYWQSVEQGNTTAEYKTYLAKYPEGEFKDIAEARIDRLHNENLPIAEKTPLAPDLVLRTGRLSVKVDPPDARIRIMNIVPRYRDGIELALNREYDVLVTKSGFKSWRRNVRLSDDKQVVEVVLLKQSVTASSITELVDKSKLPEFVVNAQNPGTEGLVATSPTATKMIVETTPVEAIAKQKPLALDPASDSVGAFDGEWIAVVNRTRKKVQFGPIKDVFGDETYFTESCQDLTGTEHPFTVKNNAITMRVSEPVIESNGKFDVRNHSKILEGSLRTKTGLLTNKKDSYCTSNLIFHMQQPLALDSVSNGSGEFDGNWIAIVDRTEKDVAVEMPHPVNDDEMLAVNIDCQDLAGTEYPFVVENSRMSVLLDEPIVGSLGKFRFTRNSKTLSGSLRKTTGQLTNNEDHRGCISTVTYRRR